MRWFLAAFFFAAPLLAQAPSAPSMADLDKARMDISRLEELVREGAVAKTRLDQAKASLADAEDEAVLKRTLFGHLSVQDLTDGQTSEMVAAARRRLERIQPKLETIEKLVADGVMARTELAPVLDELDIRRRTLELAESRARTFKELLDMVESEQEAAARAADDRAATPQWRAAEKFEGSGIFRIAMLRGIEDAYKRKFERELPISAMGMTELHRSLGFDHRDRVDVALAPDTSEGLWLRRFLELNRIPYFAFRSFVRGQATSPHIHIGPPSLRLPRFSSVAGAP